MIRIFKKNKWTGQRQPSPFSSFRADPRPRADLFCSFKEKPSASALPSIQGGLCWFSAAVIGRQSHLILGFSTGPSALTLSSVLHEPFSSKGDASDLFVSLLAYF